MTMRFKRGFIALAAAVFCSLQIGSNAAQAASPPQECTAVKDVNVRSGTVSINVKVGDLITMRADSTSPSGVVDISYYGAAPVPVNFPTSFAPVQDGVITISQNAGGAIITCSRTNSALLLLYINTQSQQIMTSVVMNMRSRFGQGGNTATQNSLFMSTRNAGAASGANRFEEPELNAWFSAEWRQYSGGTDGHSADIVFGIDKFIGADTLLGLYVAYGQQDLRIGATTSNSKSPAVGLYLSHQFAPGTFLDSSFGVARPKYDGTAGSFTATRYLGAVSYSGTMQVNGMTLAPFIRASGYVEHQPANTIHSLTTSVGTRITPQTAWENGVMPYLSIAADYGRLSDDLGASDTYFAPRVGLGLSADMARGRLNVDFDAGKVNSTTRDYGLRVTYEMKF